MTRSGNVDEPTREMPGYHAGRAAVTGPEPGDAGPADGQPGGTGPDPVPPAAPVGPSRSRGRGLLWLAVATGLVLALVLVGLRVVTSWPGFDNPFTREQTDRSQPALLQSIRDLSRFVAAEGNYQVVIDLQDNRRYLPEILYNQRTLFVAAGSVDAYVDFGSLADGAVVRSADGKSVTVQLPAPRLDDAALDIEKSYVFAEERGLLNQLGDLFGSDPNRQKQVYLLAEQRIAAAAADSGLAARAQENTRKMLDGLLRSLGFETVSVTFANP